MRTIKNHKIKKTLTKVFLKTSKNQKGKKMFNLKEKLEFLEDGIDFPFYNDIPKLSIAEWMLVLISIILVLDINLISEIPQEWFSLSVFIVTVIPALYICKGNYGLFFKMPKSKDFKLIVLCLIGYYVYGFIMGRILEFIGTGDVVHAGISSFASPDLFFVANMLLQLLQEEFFKIFMFLFVMYIVYKHTSNRNWALGLGVFFALIIFGLAHYDAYDGNILQIIFIQGFGSIFYFYPYLKTKSVVLPYIIHVIIDFLPVVMYLLMTFFGIPITV